LRFLFIFEVPEVVVSWLEIVECMIELSDDDDQRLSSQLIEYEDKEDVTKRVRDSILRL
jgi:hypothetical protein